MCEVGHLTTASKRSKKSAKGSLGTSGSSRLRDMVWGWGGGISACQKTVLVMTSNHGFGGNNGKIIMTLSVAEGRRHCHPSHRSRRKMVAQEWPRDPVHVTHDWPLNSQNSLGLDSKFKPGLSQDNTDSWLLIVILLYKKIFVWVFIFFFLTVSSTSSRPLHLHRGGSPKSWAKDKYSTLNGLVNEIVIFHICNVLHQIKNMHTFSMDAKWGLLSYRSEDWGINQSRAYTEPLSYWVWGQHKPRSPSQPDSQPSSLCFLVEERCPELVLPQEGSLAVNI